ncbi:MAG: hypothetical protein IPP73_00410 [Chitinophagaceae bacterium]|nr:hypothetical protein [Chitinophagaceae bacterium]
MTSIDNTSFFFNTRRPTLLLFAAWAMVQALVHWQYGIVTELEAHKYIEQADLLLDNGHVETPNFWLYSTQIFLIAGAKWTHAGFGAIVILQMLLNGFATFQFYRFSRKHSQPLTAFLITLLLIINWPYQSFNTYLYTESIFFSLTIIFSTYLFSLEKFNWKTFVTVTLLLTLLCVTRPTGILFLPCTFLYLLIRFFGKLHPVLKIFLALDLSWLFIVLLNLALGSGGEFDFLLPFREAHIICGVPTLNASGVVSGYQNTIGGIIKYITNHPGDAIGLFFKRTLAFFGLYRSYYSTGHNLYLALSFYPVFAAALYGIIHWWKSSKALVVYCITIIISTWGMVMLTCDDWHNRFFLVLVPFIYWLAMPLLDKCVTYFSGKNASD